MKWELDGKPIIEQEVAEFLLASVIDGLTITDHSSANGVLCLVGVADGDHAWRVADYHVVVVSKKRVVNLIGFKEEG